MVKLIYIILNKASTNVLQRNWENIFQAHNFFFSDLKRERTNLITDVCWIKKSKNVHPYNSLNFSLRYYTVWYKYIFGAFIEDSQTSLVQFEINIEQPHQKAYFPRKGYSYIMSSLLDIKVCIIIIWQSICIWCHLTKVCLYCYQDHAHKNNTK